MPATRRLPAILAADVAGYNLVMGEGEAGTTIASPRIHLLHSIAVESSRRPATGC